MNNEKKIFWLWAGWVASYLQRSLSAQVNGGGGGGGGGGWTGPDATPDLWKQPFSAVRASGGYPANVNQWCWQWSLTPYGLTRVIFYIYG